MRSMTSGLRTTRCVSSRDPPTMYAGRPPARDGFGLDLLRSLRSPVAPARDRRHHGPCEPRHGGRGDAPGGIRLLDEAVPAGPGPRGPGASGPGPEPPGPGRGPGRSGPSRGSRGGPSGGRPRGAPSVRPRSAGRHLRRPRPDPGESGTGKGVLARAAHAWSRRAAGPFVTVSCPSRVAELLESDLFGHVPGAFTGAVRDAAGKVAAAEGGTLFLDEAGDLPLPLQPKLLRFLKEKRYERVGEATTRSADVRIVAATNRDLEAAVAAGSFREDLLYRRNVIALGLPPLRKRIDTIAMANHLLAFLVRQLGRRLAGFTAEAARRWRGTPGRATSESCGTRWSGPRSWPPGRRSAPTTSPSDSAGAAG